MASAVCTGNGGSLSFGCLWLIDVFRGLLILCAVVVISVVVVMVVLTEPVVFKFFGATKALVCFKSERSLHKAEINGKSKCLLFSLKTCISIGFWGDVLIPGVDCSDDVFEIFWRIDGGFIGTKMKKKTQHLTKYLIYIN